MPPDLMRSSKSIVRSPFASLVEVETDLDKAIEGADVVMALRLQKERQHAGFLPSMREYIRRWQVTDTRLGLAAPSAMVMHPGPMNEGIEISNSVAHGGRSMIEEQVTNGVAVRMALLYELTIGPGQEL
jgi:aspartate carbamoyltransferase catalytic subunit